jgi:hypothetical protein
MTEPSPSSEVTIYTDGACGQPGSGGGSRCCATRRTRKILTGSEPQTTNNRMELAAAVRGLLALSRPCGRLLYGFGIPARASPSGCQPGKRTGRRGALSQRGLVEAVRRGRSGRTQSAGIGCAVTPASRIKRRPAGAQAM